jgi:hypothetical protein
MANLRREAGSFLDDDASLLLLARQILGGPTDEGRAPYQIALTVCEQCGRGRQQGQGELIDVGSDIVEMAQCDAQLIGRIDSPGQNGEGEDQRHVDAHVGGVPGKARQDVPPAVRRRALRRDGGRCVVPGCRQSIFLDLHHVVLRSEGGDDIADNLITVCGAHHRALHRGQLAIEGRVSSGLVFRHADGAAYGRVADPRAATVYEQAFQALRSLGFREADVRRALDSLRADAHVGNVTVESVLRRALAVLTTEH